MLEYSLLIGAVALLLIAVVLTYLAKVKRDLADRDASAMQEKLQRVRKEIDVERREASFKIKDELYKRRKDFEYEVKREKVEHERMQNKLNHKFEDLGKKEQHIEELKLELQHKERNVSRMEDRIRSHEVKLKDLYDELINKLENVGGLSKEEAEKVLLDTLEAEVKLTREKWIQKVEDDSRQIAKDKAADIVVTAMQRYTTDHVIPHSSSVVHLPNEDMKGRIIGKEGRNIKSLEMATGMEFVIGEAPEVITISGFNPVRREIAKRSLEKLIADGRINPTRIEETVLQCEKEIDETIQEYGKETVLEFNLQGVDPEIVTLLGKLHFRTSYSQNVLEHSKEVGMFSRMIAEELGLNPKIAFRAGLLHDIGKAVTAEVEGPHALIGADIAKRCGEDPKVINGIAAHHQEVPYTSIYGPIVVIADTISASRPGARRETFPTYVKRLEDLEEIGKSFEGVKKVYALQAGREIRIIVEEDMLDDEKATRLARDIAKKVEKEMNFPGQIKVNVIREKRAIEYAK
jgi:ribonucrease Y